MLIYIIQLGTLLYQSIVYNKRQKKGKKNMHVDPALIR